MGNLLPVILVALGVWLAGLTVAYYWLLSHYRRLGKGVREGNLVSILEKVIETERENRHELHDIAQELKRIDNESGPYISKLGLVRFNPFNETGGDQSFSIALLDKRNNGVILTCLHSRDRTRVYAKPVVGGKSDKNLSSEEEKALLAAQK